MSRFKPIKFERPWGPGYEDCFTAPKSWSRPATVRVTATGETRTTFTARFVGPKGDIRIETLRWRSDPAVSGWTLLARSVSTHFSVKATRK